MIGEYIYLVFPVYLLIILAIIRLKKVIRYFCREDAVRWEKDECRWYLKTVKLSLILGLIPVINLFILMEWVYLLYTDLPNCLLIKFLKKIIKTINVKLTDFVNYLVLGKVNK